MPPKRKATQSPSKATPAFTPSPSPPPSKSKTPSGQRIPQPRQPPPVRAPIRIIPSSNDRQGIAQEQANVINMNRILEQANLPNNPIPPHQRQFHPPSPSPSHSSQGSNNPPPMKKGGLIKYTGTYTLHKGEVVIPAHRVKSVEKALKEKGMKPLKK